MWSPPAAGAWARPAAWGHGGVRCAAGRELLALLWGGQRPSADASEAGGQAAVQQGTRPRRRSAGLRPDAPPFTAPVLEAPVARVEETSGQEAGMAEGCAPQQAPDVKDDFDMDGGWQAAKRPTRPRSGSGGRGGQSRGAAFRFEVLDDGGGDYEGQAKAGLEAEASRPRAATPPVRCLLTGMELGAGVGRRSGRSAPAGSRQGARAGRAARWEAAQGLAARTAETWAAAEAARQALAAREAAVRRLQGLARCWLARRAAAVRRRLQETEDTEESEVQQQEESDDDAIVGARSEGSAAGMGEAVGDGVALDGGDHDGGAMLDEASGPDPLGCLHVGHLVPLLREFEPYADALDDAFGEGCVGVAVQRLMQQAEAAVDGFTWRDGVRVPCPRRQPDGALAAELMEKLRAGGFAEGGDQKAWVLVVQRLDGLLCPRRRGRSKR